MRWKWILIIGTILIIALMVTVYVFLATYDYNKLKPRIAKLVEDATGRKLNLSGEVNLDFGFSPVLVVSNVTFANAPWSSQPEMIKIGKLQAQVHLLPLLFRDVEVRKIGLAGVEVLLETDPSGRGNWDLIAGESSDKREPSSIPTQIDINNIRIENLSLTFQDGKTGSTTQLTLISLAVNRQEAAEMLAIDLKADYKGQPVRLSGKTGLINNIIARKRFPLELSGQFSKATVKIDGAIDDVLTLNGIDLKAQASGENLAKIKLIKNIRLPKTSEFDVKGKLKGSKRSLAIENFSGKLSGSGVDVTISGTVGDLIALTDINLQLTGSGKDLAEIGSIIGKKLPATDEFKVQGRLTGSAKALSLQAAQGNARRGNLKLSLQGGIKDLIRLSGMDLKLDGSGKDLSEVGPIIGKKLPKTGEFTLEGRLMGSAKALSLKEIRGNIRRGGLRLNLQGGVKSLLTLSGMDLKLNGSGKDLADVGPIIGKKLPTTDKVTTQGRLTGSAKRLSLREVKGNVGRGRLNLTFNGGIRELFALEGINFKLKAMGKELAEIGPLVGANLPKLGPFDVSGRLSGSAKAISFNEFSAIIDNSDFNGTAIVEFLKRPKITVRLESSVIDFTPFMRLAAKDKQEIGEEDKPERRLFPKDPLPFDALKRVDADFDVKARGIHLRGAQLEFGHLTLILADSNLSIEKLEATYKETKISGNLHIDPGSPPQVATNFLVQGFNLGEFLKETGKNDQVRGIVDIAAHGKSSGDSVSSLMAHLNGAFGAVMGPGYLTQYLDLLSMDLSTKIIPFWGRNKKADEINCAVVQFDIKNGVAVSKAFVFDSQIGILSATGDTDLGTEQVNFLLNPQPKDFSLVNLSTKVRVTGTLMDPKVRPDKLSLVKKGAEEVLGVLALGPLGLLAPFVHLGAHNKHPCDVKSLGELGIQTPTSK